MNKDISQLLQASIPFLSPLVFVNSSLAQITPDGTVPTKVNQSGNVTEITGGAEKGNNLFHSFKEFSVLTGNEAFFNNALNIENIFSRVTGGSISNIDGLIRAKGSANLFLINPAGILFGRDARLNIGGSFYGSTADSLLFDDGVEFSAVNPQNPILTINAPIGLRFRDNPAPITYRSVPINEMGMLVPTVKSNQTFALIGGDINMQDSILSVEPDAKIELGGLSKSGTVEIGEDRSLRFPDGIKRADVFLTGVANIIIDNAGETGSLTINARNLEMFGQSGIFVITSNVSQVQDRAIITINASDRVALFNETIILGQLNQDAIDKVRAIDINTSSLEIISDLSSKESQSPARISALGITDSLPQNEINILNINAADKVIVDKGSIFGWVFTGGIQRGNINITTGSFELTNGALVYLNNFITPEQVADIGILEINANSIVVDNSTLGTGLGATAEINTDTNVEITANSVEVVNSGEINAKSPGLGDAGSVIINTDRLIVRDNSEISVSSQIGGKAGELKITANSVNLDGGILTASTEAETGGNINLIAEDINLHNGGQITAEATETSDGGNLSITTETLTLKDDANISTQTFGIGNAGNLNIASEQLTVSGNQARISVSNFGQGNAGNLNITTNRLVVNDGAQISASTFGQGNAGNLTINATESVELSGEGDFPSGLFAQVDVEATGKGGSLTLETANLRVTDGAKIQVSTFGEGDSGNLLIRASNIDIFETSVDNFFSTGIFAEVARINARGNGGDLSIETDNLSVRDGGQVSASTLGEGNAGNLLIQANDSIEVVGVENSDITIGKRNISTISANVKQQAIGNGGSLIIEANNLRVTDGGQVSVSTFGRGNAGDLQISATDSVEVSGTSADNQFISQLTVEAASNSMGSGGNLTVNVRELNVNGGQISAATASGEGGNITLQIDDNITLRNNSQITAKATGTANGGNININTDFVIASPNQNSDIIASAGQEGTGGRIVIDAEGVFGIEERPQNNTTNDIDASGGIDGEVIINTPDVDISKGLIETPQNVLALEQIVAQTCSVEKIVRGSSNLIVNGKGGIPPQLTAPINSDAIYIEGESVNNQTEAIEKTFQADTKENHDIVTLVKNSKSVNIDDIIPAQGAIILDNGDVILTAYPTPDNGYRSAHSKANCTL